MPNTHQSLSASRRWVWRKARSRRKGGSLSRERNTAPGPAAARPQGAHREGQAGVAVLAKGSAIGCAPRLGLTLAVGSEPRFVGIEQGEPCAS